MPRQRVKYGKQYATWSTDPNNPTPRPEDATEHPTSEGSEKVTYAILSKEYYPGDVEVPNGATITEEISLDVSWNREGEWVQVSVSVPPDKWQRISEAYNEADSNNSTEKVITTDVLTRQEINAMIKTLRRARDAAYGADE